MGTVLPSVNLHITHFVENIINLQISSNEIEQKLYFSLLQNYIYIYIFILKYLKIFNKK